MECGVPKRNSCTFQESSLRWGKSTELDHRFVANGLGEFIYLAKPW